MVPALFFGLLCLGPLSVMGTQPNWIPDRVPWPAQQCIDAGKGYVGECVISQKRGRFDPLHIKNTDPCHSLKCAEPRSDGGYSIVRLGRPMDGTICGILKACRKGMCYDIDPSDVPIQYGIRTTFECTKLNITPKPVNLNTKKIKAPFGKI